MRHAPRKRKRRASDKLDDLARPVENIDVTVARLFGATSLPTTTLPTDLASSSPVLVSKVPTEKTVPKESVVKKVLVDKSNVLLPYDTLLEFQTESFCCQHCINRKFLLSTLLCTSYQVSI
jgi:hypothetical protein